MTDTGGGLPTIKPFLSVSGVYDTGLTAVSVDATGKIPQTDDFGGEVGFGAIGYKRWRRTVLGIDYRGSLRKYARASYYDGSDHMLSLSVTRAASGPDHAGSKRGSRLVRTQLRVGQRLRAFRSRYCRGARERAIRLQDHLPVQHGQPEVPEERSVVFRHWRKRDDRPQAERRAGREHGLERQRGCVLPNEPEHHPGRRLQLRAYCVHQGLWLVGHPLRGFQCHLPAGTPLGAGLACRCGAGGDAESGPQSISTRSSRPFWVSRPGSSCSVTRTSSPVRGRS